MAAVVDLNDPVYEEAVAEHAVDVHSKPGGDPPQIERLGGDAVRAQVPEPEVAHVPPAGRHRARAWARSGIGERAQPMRERGVDDRAIGSRVEQHRERALPGERDLDHDPVARRQKPDVGDQARCGARLRVQRGAGQHSCRRQEPAIRLQGWTNL